MDSSNELGPGVVGDDPSEMKCEAVCKLFTEKHCPVCILVFFEMIGILKRKAIRDLKEEADSRA